MTWEARAQEAEALSDSAGNPEIDRRLLELLLDQEDTAVTFAAARALLARRDQAGVRLIAHAFDVADALPDETTWYWLRDAMADGTGEAARLLTALLPSLLEDESSHVREGAADLLQCAQEYLGQSGRPSNGDRG